MLFCIDGVDIIYDICNIHTVESEAAQNNRRLQLTPPLQSDTKPMAVAYNLKKTLGGSLWKWIDGEEKVFTVVGPIRAGKSVTNPRSGIAKAPDIMTVRDAADGNEKDILVGAVLRSSLTENYPDDSYVGLTFACTQGAVKPGTRYKTMAVAEVEVDNIPAPTPFNKNKKK